MGVKVPHDAGVHAGGIRDAEEVVARAGIRRPVEAGAEGRRAALHHDISRAGIKKRVGFIAFENALVKQAFGIKPEFPYLLRFKKGVCIENNQESGEQSSEVFERAGGVFEAERKHGGDGIIEAEEIYARGKFGFFDGGGNEKRDETCGKNGGE